MNIYAYYSSEFLSSAVQRPVILGLGAAISWEKQKE